MENLVKDEQKIEIRELKDVVYLESISPLIKAYTIDDKEIIYSYVINEINDFLPADKFFRINESTIINVDFLKRIKVNSTRSVLLHNDVELSVDQHRYDEFVCFLKYKYDIG